MTAAFPEQIETKRLRFRPPVLQDAELIFAAYAQDPAVFSCGRRTAPSKSRASSSLHVSPPGKVQPLFHTCSPTAQAVRFLVCWRCVLPGVVPTSATSWRRRIGGKVSCPRPCVPSQNSRCQPSRSFASTQLAMSTTKRRCAFWRKWLHQGRSSCPLPGSSEHFSGATR